MTHAYLPYELDLPAEPPRARRLPKILALHGETLVDEYAWMRDRDDPDVLAHLRAENEYAEAMMEPTRWLQDELYGEMLSRIRETDVQVPFRLGEFLYYSRTEKGKQYPIHCRRRDEGAAEEVLLDLNELADRHDYLALGEMEVSDDGHLLAFTLDTKGEREFVLRVRDLRTGEMLPERMERVSSVVWAADNRTLLYVSDDHTRRPHRLYRHTLGARADVLVHEETDPLFRLGVARSRSRDILLVVTASATSSEIRMMRADHPEERPVLVEPRRPNLQYFAEHRGNRLWIITNDRGPNFRLVTAPLADPGAARWEEVLPHREHVRIEDIEVFARHLVVLERENGLDCFLVLDLETGDSHRIRFSEPAYSAAPTMNASFDTAVFRLAYESFVTPLTVYDYDMSSRSWTLLKRTEVLGGYDPGGYVSERIFATAEDGTRIPVSIVHRRGLDRSGPQPMVLYGYGAYGSSVPVTFSPERLPLLDRGVIYAVAHVRGGGEMGEAWHEQGRLARKENSFTDFLAVAGHLVRQGWTAPDRLVISGASAGGLLIAGVINLRPELFRAAVMHVPFVDVLATMMDPDLPLTVGEYPEWGNPEDEDEYRVMRRYDPYWNIRKAPYPAMLVRTSFHDGQVMFWEAARYVARLRATTTGDQPLLLRVDMDGGHSGPSGRYDRLRDEAWECAFILTQLGLWD